LNVAAKRSRLVPAFRGGGGLDLSQIGFESPLVDE
jgi:hypothetical protein